jgi:plasmid stabilization system protein ParE
VKYRVELSAKAEWDVDGVLRWYHEHNAAAAGGRWLGKLMSRIDTLETDPTGCRFADEAEALGIELRELLFGKRRGKYRILFVIDAQTVSILHIRRGARSAVTGQDLH